MSPARGKILLLVPQPFFQWRGSPIRVGFTALALAQLGFEVDLLVLPFGENRDIPGVRVLRVPNLLGLKNMTIGPSFLKAVYDGILFFKAWGLVTRQHYDFIHAVEEAAALGVFLAGRSGARLIYEKHSDPNSYRGGFVRNLVMSLYGRTEKFSARHADAIIGTGPGLVEQARRAAPDKPVHHIFDIPSSLTPVDDGKAAELRRGLRKTPDEVLVTYVGSFAVYQGIELLFHAMALVLARHPAVRFIIIGGTPDEIAERTDWLRRQGMDSRVTFLGKIPPDALPDVLAASDILLSPRISGVNTPLKLLDYFKADRAIVATDNAANRQLLDDTCAVLVPAEPEAFAAGIGRLVQDAALRSRLAAEGRRRIQATYNFEEFKRRLNACYEQLETGRVTKACK
ncbi:MAG: glycosyltransferase family 4 protein [Lentisphaerae bacterium]|nr:glycosyltransferase family 4 protein [Lentisphaerota bacterium]